MIWKYIASALAAIGYAATTSAAVRQNSIKGGFVEPQQRRGHDLRNWSLKEGDMRLKTFSCIASTVLALITITAPADAQKRYDPGARNTEIKTDNDGKINFINDDAWTVLTMAPDGSWGVATEMEPGRAIGRAIANCKKMYKKEIGCGAISTRIRAGWSLAMRCGSENIIAAEKTLTAAEGAAVRREHELRTVYVQDMPACRRVLTVDPLGLILMPDSELGLAAASMIETRR